MPKRNLRLGEMLLKAGIIDEFQLNSALSHQRHWGGQIGSSLVKLGYIGEERLLKFLAEQLNLTRIDLSRLAIRDEVLSYVPVEKALEYNVIPVDRKEMYGTVYLLVAMSNPTDLIVIDSLQFATGCRIRPAIASRIAIKEAIERCYGTLPSTLKKPAKAPELDDKVWEERDPGKASPLENLFHAPMTSEEKLDRLLKLLMDKGILSDAEYEQFK